MQGKLIVIEGLDGSGKATQTGLLYDALLAQGKRVMKVTFPDYESDSSALVKMYLAGKFGDAPGDVNAYAASAFYAVDRYASFKTSWKEFYEKGGMVIADRYTTSNAIHQCSKLPRDRWDEYLKWLFEFEYALMGIPAPDKVIYLQTATSISQKLMSGRYQGDERRKDIHERDLAYLDRSRQAADYCAQVLGWTKIICSVEGEMRPVEDIHREVLRSVDL